MPLIRIDLFPGRSHEMKTDLARAITRLFAEKAGIAPSDTTVIFNEVAPSDWMVGGVPLATTSQEG